MKAQIKMFKITHSFSGQLVQVPATVTDRPAPAPVTMETHDNDTVTLPKDVLLYLVKRRILLDLLDEISEPLISGEISTLDDLYNHLEFLAQW